MRPPGQPTDPLADILADRWPGTVSDGPNPDGQPYWDSVLDAMVVRQTENWVVLVAPMMFNDRILLCERATWRRGYVAGWCYPKGPAAALAALVWDPEVEVAPVGYVKVACDARPQPPGDRG